MEIPLVFDKPINLLLRTHALFVFLNATNNVSNIVIVQETILFYPISLLHECLYLAPFLLSILPFTIFSSPSQYELSFWWKHIAPYTLIVKSTSIVPPLRHFYPRIVFFSNLTHQTTTFYPQSIILALPKITTNHLTPPTSSIALQTRHNGILLAFLPFVRTYPYFDFCFKSLKITIHCLFLKLLPLAKFNKIKGCDSVYKKG